MWGNAGSSSEGVNISIVVALERFNVIQQVYAGTGNGRDL